MLVPSRAAPAAPSNSAAWRSSTRPATPARGRRSAGPAAAVALLAVLAACAESPLPTEAPAGGPAPVAAPRTMLLGAALPTADGARPVPLDLTGTGSGGAYAAGVRADVRAPVAPGGEGDVAYDLAALADALGDPEWTSAIVGFTRRGGPQQTAVEARPVAGFPTAGASFLVVSSGDARHAGSDASYLATPCVGGYCDIGGVDVEIAVPAGMTEMAFDVRFWTQDTIPYNDYFRATVVAPGGADQVVLARSVDVEFPVNGPGPRIGATVHQVVVDVSAWAGQTITLRLEAADARDWGCASGALVDGLRFRGPALTLAKVATDGATIAAGEPLRYTLEVTNTGTVAAAGVVLTDALPAGLGLDWSVQGPAAGCAVTGTDAQTLTCDIGTLAPGATRTVTVGTATTAAACGVYDNTATVTATGLPSRSSSASTTVTCPPPPTGLCEGGVSKLVVKYVGAAPLAGEVRGKRLNPQASAILPAIVTGVGPNALYTFAVQSLGGQFTGAANGRLANEFVLYIGGTAVAQVHTSCSAPIYPGMQIAGLFEVVEVHSLNGGIMGADAAAPSSSAPADGGAGADDVDDGQGPPAGKGPPPGKGKGRSR